MKPVVKSDAQRRPNQPTQLPKTEIPSRAVFGFPVSVNQFQFLEDSKSAESTYQSQSEDRLVDPRKTRLVRLQAATGSTEQRTLGNLSSEGIFETVPPINDAQGTFDNEDSVEPVASRICPSFFPYSVSVSPPDILESQSDGVVQNLLEPGAVDDAVYINNVNDVACTDGICNKRISYAGPERSAGRPGHTPTRCNLACGKTTEDSCAGHDWSAGRPGNRPFGASTAVCPSPNTACIGPYGTAYGQPHHTGPNTHEEKSVASSSTRRP